MMTSRVSLPYKNAVTAAPPAARRRPWWLPGVFALWLGLRLAFFEGLWGYDDLYHVRWAVHPRVPADVWEARLLFNGLLLAAYRAFGFAEWVFALPTLLGSLLFVGATTWAAWRLRGERAAMLAGVLASILAGDVLRATDPMANPVGNGFAALGTALVVAGRGRRALIGGGVALGLAVYTHLAHLFYVAPFGLAVALHDWPRRRWREAFAVLAVAGATAAVLDLGVFWVVAGDPLHHLGLLRRTHLEIQQYVIPPRLPDGSWNPEWFTWPFARLLFSKDFALFLSLPLAVVAATWRRQPRPARLLAAILVCFWAWVSFGTQHPLAYAPLDHQVRYWHPMALPAVLLAVFALGALERRRRRAALAALVLPVPLLLLSSGPWGQNVEISRELMAHAAAHPETIFATDPYTYDEMYVLNGCAPPANVTVLRGFPDPEFHRPPDAARLDPEQPGLEVLFNPLNMGRVRTRDFERLVAERLERRPISEARPRAIAALLPPALWDEHPWLVRKPPAWLAVQRP